jgi:purine nucleoside permease
LHGTTVIDIQDNVVERQLDDIVGNLLGYAPALDDLVDLGWSLLRDLIKNWGVWWVEVLETLLLDTRL